MKLFKKFLIVSLLGFAFTFVATHFADFNFAHTTAEASSLKNDVKSKSTATLTNTVDKAGSNVVKFARDIGIVALIVLLIAMGYSLFVKKSVEGLADMKGRMGAACIAIAFVFFSEQILGALFGIFGYTI